MKINQITKNNPNSDFEVAQVAIVETLGMNAYRVLIELADWKNNEAAYVEKWSVGTDKLASVIDDGLCECYEKIGARLKEHPTKTYGWRKSEGVKWFKDWPVDN